MIPELPNAEMTPSEGEAVGDDGTSERSTVLMDGDDTVSITSHEFGTMPEEERSEDLSGDDDEPELLDMEFREVFFQKGQRRIIHQAERAVKELAQAKNVVHPEVPRIEGRNRGRRPGSWRVVEVFTWTMAISACACSCGWEVGEPVTLPNWNLLRVDHQEEALRYLNEFDPDLLVLAWPCTVWSPLQNLSAVTRQRIQKLIEKRREQRRLLAWTAEAVRDQRARAGLVLGENPWSSKAWKEEVIVTAFEGLGYVRADMCQYGLRRPASEFSHEMDRMMIKKPTCLAGDPELISGLERHCQGHHHHAPCLGGVRDRAGRWIKISDFAGGYTKVFAKAVVDQAEKVLARRRGKLPLPISFVKARGLPDEVFVESDEEVAADIADLPSMQELFGSDDAADDEEPVVDNSVAEGGLDEDREGVPEKLEEPRKEGRPEKGSLLQRLHLVHRRLGHPSNETLVRMLQLGGASEELVEHARNLECASCAQRSPPPRPLPARPDARPVLFNHVVHLDLKYQHDMSNQSYVALSIVDGATSYHVARLLRTRDPAHVAQKFLSGWIGVYGIPNEVVCDQGGEFETEFIGLLESYAIASRMTGSYAPWQNGFVERHNGLLGVAWTAIIEEQRLSVRQAMKSSLACALQAKNMTITRRGYSAQTLVFGREAFLPELLEEEIWSSSTLGQSLAVESEVARQAEMRAAARVALLRGDVLEKLRKALRRAPSGARTRSFVPGEFVYFWSPQTGKKARYRQTVGAWRGPAIVLVPEGSGRYFVSWRGRCLLLAVANMKPASLEEGQDQALRLREAESHAEKGYIDLSQDGEPPPEPEAQFRADDSGRVRVRRVRNGMGRRMTEARRMMSGLKSVKKVLKGPLPTRRRMPSRRAVSVEPVREESDAVPGEPRDEVLRDGEAPPGVHDPPLGVRGPPYPADDWMEQDDVPLPPPRDDHPLRVDEEPDEDTLRRRRGSLDDVPWVVKRKIAPVDLTGEQVSKRFRQTGASNYVLAALCEDEFHGEVGPRNEWLPRREVELLGKILDLPLGSARLHRAPRKCLQTPPGPNLARSRIIW